MTGSDDRGQVAGLAEGGGGGWEHVVGLAGFGGEVDGKIGRKRRTGGRTGGRDGNGRRTETG